MSGRNYERMGQAEIDRIHARFDEGATVYRVCKETGRSYPAVKYRHDRWMALRDGLQSSEETVEVPPLTIREARRVRRALTAEVDALAEEIENPENEVWTPQMRIHKHDLSRILAKFGGELRGADD